MICLRSLGWQSDPRKFFRTGLAACLKGYSGDVRGHRNQIAEEARQEIRTEESDVAASTAADQHRENGGKQTGEEQAATNREQDPPA
jgi:hypothetical protein